METNFQNVQDFFADINSGKLKIVAGDATRKLVSAQMEIAKKFLAEQHQLVVPDNKLYVIEDRPIDITGKLLMPVVCSHDNVMARLSKTPGVNYNYPREKGYTCAKAFGFDRRFAGLYFIVVNDSIEPDVELRISFDAKQEQKPDVNCERISEYMAQFDYVLHTQQQQLDSGNTYTRTESLYSFDDELADGYSQDGEFGLNWCNRGNANAYGGFRAVSDVILVS